MLSESINFYSITIEDDNVSYPVYTIDHINKLEWITGKINVGYMF